MSSGSFKFPDGSGSTKGKYFLWKMFYENKIWKYFNLLKRVDVLKNITDFTVIKIVIGKFIVTRFLVIDFVA